jgi:hypothetical protein
VTEQSASPRPPVVRSASCVARGPGMMYGEPNLDEILIDPIVLAMMRSDGLTVDDVVGACEAARQALRRPSATN